MLSLSTAAQADHGVKDDPVGGRSHGRRAPMVRKWGAYAAAVVARLKELAPYAVIALVVPGGSLIALPLWLYRRQKKVPECARGKCGEFRGVGFDANANLNGLRIEHGGRSIVSIR
jgi:hypothetical protein